MNILILSWRGPKHPLAGGAERVTNEHAKGWVKADHKVTLFTSYFAGAKSRENINGIQVIRRGDQFFGVKVAAFFWYIFENKEKFDLIIDEFHGVPFFTPLWPSRAKRMAFIHEVAQKVWGLNPWPYPFNKIAAFFGKIGEPFIFRLFYRNVPFMTVSKSTKEDLKNWGIKKVTVVQNGVALLRKLPEGKKEKDFTIIYLSAIAKDKGIEDALAAFNSMKKRIPGVRLWVLGKGYGDYLKYLHKLSPEAKFFGFVSERKKFELLAKAHLLIFPSVHEGWGLVVIEAAAVGTPTIAYTVSGVKDSVIDGETGLLVKRLNPEPLSDAAVKLYKDRRLYRRLSYNSKRRSKSFTWEKARAASLDLINKL